ncbi:MAG: hypothetical protein IPJ65_17930 [Archangiaceae bacterium]|nr:hypothetical protein [Archangiaceae bacterium]
MRLLLLAVLATGCATTSGLGTRRLPYEARVYLLDTEEDLMTARARSEQAARDLWRARHALGDADARSDALRESPLKSEAKSQVAVAQARVAREERQLELLDAAAGCSQRRYAAARARTEVRFKLDGADEAEASRLDERAAACEAKLGQRAQALSDAEERLARARSEEERASIAAAAQAPLEHPRPWVE